uniref:Large ribosomal subunit protein eL24 n=1 Tax=Trichogramma kaykai TaxID=54128 RepID=A0ABD2X256_9HYME
MQEKNIHIKINVQVNFLPSAKIGLCAYSGYKIYPGHGKTMVKVDGKNFTFLNSKCESAHLMKRNPRKVTWTVLYRRKHKKGQEEEMAKKRTRRTQKYQRAIVGASLTDIMAKRNMKPEIRKAQREQAIKAAKEQKKAAKAVKKAAAPAKPKPVHKQKATKVQPKAAPRVGGKR